MKRLFLILLLSPLACAGAPVDNPGSSNPTTGGKGGAGSGGGAGKGGSSSGSGGSNHTGGTAGSSSSGGAAGGGNGGSGTSSGGSGGGGGGSDSGSGGATGSASMTGQGLFLASAPWYQDISGAALDSESSQAIAGLAAKGGWGSGSLKIDFSIEVLHADASVQPRPFTPNADFYEPDCDTMAVPVPPGGHLEGETDYACANDGDCHLIVVQGTKLYEMWRANISGGKATGGTFAGGCLAVWDLTRDYWKPAQPPAPFSRGDQCSSADAAGYPISDLLFSADEVKAGEIKHAIRFILPNDRIRKGAYLHPATHSGAGKGSPTPDTVPYGARLRLKAGVDISGLKPGAQVVARALKRYGMFLADGGNIALTAKSDASTDAKWDGLLNQGDLGALKVTDFEMVEGGERIPLTFDCTRSPL